MKENSSKPSPIVVGLALFCMFFGSGNLIFPLFLGQVAQDNWLIALFGFMITAVCLPLLGIIAMVMFEGHSKKFFDLLGRPWGFLLTLVLLLVWIPFGSAPRCISLSFASLSTYLPIGNAWTYGAIYSLIAAFIVVQGSRMLNILGAYLTPILLICLAAIFFGGLTSMPTTSSSLDTANLVFQSLKEGYNTMDLIASFFFSASVIALLQKQGGSLSSNLKLTFKAGFVAAITLAVVYSALLYTAATHSADLVNVNKEQMLAHLAMVTLGTHLGGIAAAAIFLACITTSVALVSVFTDFLTNSVFRNKSMYMVSLVLTSLVSYFMSITGLEGITAVTSPALQVCYPLLLVIIIWGVVKRSMELTSQKKQLKEQEELS
ncbi:MAG: branched-chain amino acid transport system II carrier protein [Parachlamydiales bacterium]|jgi:LIVCS family branched-chain amino acid:cation transporter